MFVVESVHFYMKNCATVSLMPVGTLPVTRAVFVVKNRHVYMKTGGNFYQFQSYHSLLSRYSPSHNFLPPFFVSRPLNKVESKQPCGKVEIKDFKANDIYSGRNTLYVIVSTRLLGQHYFLRTEYSVTGACTLLKIQCQIR